MLRQLEFLIGIADLGSISACAEYFGVTQPSVTNQIHRLEEELSSELLVRSARGATLTEVGEKIVLQAKRVLQEVHRIPLIAEEAKQSITGRIALGVSPLLPIHHFPEIYGQFHRDFPEIKIEMVEVDALHLTDQIRNNQVDLGLIPLPLFSTKVQYEVLWSEELVVISSPEEHLSDAVTMDSLRGRDFIFMRPGFSLNLTVAHLAQRAGFDPHVVTEASGIHSLLGFVASGIGIAIVPRATVFLEANSGIINVSRLLPAAHRRVAMVFRDRSQLSPAVHVFMNYIRMYAQKTRNELLVEHFDLDEDS